MFRNIELTDRRIDWATTTELLALAGGVLSGFAVAALIVAVTSLGEWYETLLLEMLFQPRDVFLISLPIVGLFAGVYIVRTRLASQHAGSTLAGIVAGAGCGILTSAAFASLLGSDPLAENLRLLVTDLPEITLMYFPAAGAVVAVVGLAAFQEVRE